jgi:hypothetical protein
VFVVSRDVDQEAASGSAALTLAGHVEQLCVIG